MKRLLMAVCLVVTLGMPLASMVSSTPAHAANVVNAIDIPLIGTVPNPCNGETVDFSGYLHVVFNVTGDLAGGFHVSFHDNTQGVRAVGETTGVQYVANETDHVPTTVNFTPGATNETESIKFNLISQGSAPNFVEYAAFHITINADGTVTAFVDTFRPTCRG